jgi:hypothetical protein
MAFVFLSCDCNNKQEPGNEDGRFRASIFRLIVMIPAHADADAVPTFLVSHKVEEEEDDNILFG